MSIDGMTRDAASVRNLTVTFATDADPVVARTARRAALRLQAAGATTP